MKTITCWDDLSAYGIVALTGESCGLGYRILCDVTAKGKNVLEKCLGVPGLNLPSSWNPGSGAEPHVGSILLSPEMLPPVAVFALLESGHAEVWVGPNGSVYAPDPDDSHDAIECLKRWLGVEAMRRFAYRGTASDRNVHVLSGRVR